MKKKVLIVGGTGFLGFNLAKKLMKKNFDIHSLSSNPPVPSRKIKKVNYIFSNIENIKSLKKKIKPSYDFVINLSGNINHKKQVKTLKTHYLGLKNLVNIFSKTDLKCFIQIGSSLEYGRISSPNKESQKCKPVSYYGKAKYLASKHLIDFDESNSFPFIILRLYQVFGPKQKEDRLIPYVISSCKKDKKFKCTDGKQLRDFLYVDDFTSLVIKICNKKKINKGIYNVGFGKTVKIKFVIETIRKIIGKGKPLFGAIKMRKDETKILFPDISKTKKEFGWKPKITFFKGIKNILN